MNIAVRISETLLEIDRALWKAAASSAPFPVRLLAPHLPIVVTDAMWAVQQDIREPNGFRLAISAEIAEQMETP